MITVSESIITNNKAQLESLLTASGVGFAGAERLTELHTQVAKAAFADVAQHLKSLTEVKDLQAWTEAQARAGQPVAERLASYTRGVYAVISETNKNFAKLIEAQVTEFNKTCATALDQVAKNTPAGAETTIAFAKSALAASNQAYDALSKATRQITEVADSAVETSAKKKAA